LLHTHYWHLPKKAIIQMLGSFSLKSVNLKFWYLSTILYVYFYKVIWSSCRI
jgi:hypothetical protein